LKTVTEKRSGTFVGRAVLRTQSDERLIRLTREGQDAAYEEIVRRYRPRLVRQAAAIVPAHRAEDVVQESLARALSAMRASDAEIALGAWLATIVRNRSLNDLRDERGPHEELDDQFDGVPQPPTVAAQRQEVRDVVVAIGMLPEQQRRALVGRELEGLSHEQIAAELGITAGSARGLIFRARAAVRDALGAVIPLPAVRMLSEVGAAEVSGAAAGAGAAVAGSSAGMKTAVGVLAVLATVGSGVAVERRLSDRDSSGPDGASRADAATPRPDPTGDESRTGPGSPGPSDRDEDRTRGEPADREGSDDGSRRDDGDDDSSGPGSGDDSGHDDRSGHGGGGESGGEGSSGHGGSGSSGSGGGGHSGPGGGGDDPQEPAQHDNSGPGSGDDADEHDNSGSSSGSGSGSGGDEDEPES
jgi:RNA polymerase sigma factor (sigma-70 family)